MRGYLDKIKTDDVTRFERRLLDEVHAHGADILEGIRKDKALSKDNEAKLKAFLDKFAADFS